MLEELNDDCWLKILEYVDKIGDQLALARTSRNLRGIVDYHWRHIKKASVDNGLIEYFEEHPDDMHNFLRLASGSLEELEVKRGNLKLLESWKSYQFPRVHSLNCTIWNSDLEGADNDTLMLTELFPHLKNLTLEMGGSGQHLWRWSQLQELHLLCCEFLDTSTFEQIFSTLPLKKVTLLYYGYNTNLGPDVKPISLCSTLEELVIDDHHLLGEFMHNLLNLPHFRRVAFYTRDYSDGLVQSVSKLKPLGLQSLLFNDVFWSSSRLTDYTCSFTNLRRLVLHDDDVETKLLYNICSTLPHLEELHLIKMRGLPTPTQIWKMVAVCSSLKCLNLSHNELDEQFVELSSSCLNRVLNMRSPLTLLLHHTNLSRNPQTVSLSINLYLCMMYTTIICSLFQTLDALEHPKLVISFKPNDLEIWSSRFIEMEFNCTADE